MAQFGYVYTYGWTKEERSLCRLEQRSFFGFDSESSNIESGVRIDPSRSPFIRARIDVMYEGESVDQIAVNLKQLKIKGATYKVVVVKNEDQPSFIDYKERLQLARIVGSQIDGEPNLSKPDRIFALMHVNGRWVFGEYYKNNAIWLRHQKKPHSYSTALSTRLARAVVNIAVPRPEGVKVIDPCCGMGTVLVEACSMGIHIVGSDLNWLVMPGARGNLAHFGYECEVKRTDIKKIDEFYDVAIIDMPYNICCVATPEEQLEIIESARKVAQKVVFITTEEIDMTLRAVGFTIIDRCVAQKGTFTRQILVCEGT